MIRRSVAIGFYPGSERQLRHALDSFFSNLGGLPQPGTPHSMGGLVPHAGYVFSGQVAAYTFAEFRKLLPDTFVILGPNHRGLGSPVAIMTSGKWSTPFGDIEIDEPLANHIYHSCSILDDDPTAHSEEHSIEVQLPFIQYIGGKKFVPISMAMQDAETALEVGTAIAEASKDKNVGIVASSDLTHYGVMYGFRPTTEDNALEWMKEVDGQFLTGIEKMSKEMVHEASEKTTSCGHGCISAMITACEKLGLKTPEILEYRTSFEVSGETSAIVGYGSAVIR